MCDMFCFQCEQTTGGTGCQGKVGACGKTESAAVLQDQLTGALMALIYVVSIVVGAQSRGLFELSENGGIALSQIADYYLGRMGTWILAIAITFACLKTSIGLVTSCAETFVKCCLEKLQILHGSWEKTAECRCGA